MSYVVYKHTNKINNKVYIGITGKSPEDRWGKNGNKYSKKSQPIFYNAIQKYGWDNFIHEILFEKLTKKEAYEKEKELIAFYDSTNHEKGYNCSTGGEASACGCKWTEEHKKKISMSLIGHEISAETREKISNTLKSLHLTCPNAKKVRYKKTGETFDSICDASRKTLIDRSVIYRHLNGTRKKPLWEYLSESEVIT